MITNELLEGFILTCTSCPKICRRNPYPFPAYYEGSYQKSLMVIGQSPGVEHEYPTVSSKEYLDLYRKNFKRCNFYSYLNTIGIRSDSYYFTNIIKCPLNPGETVDPSYVENCSKYLRLQLHLVKPSIIILLSKYAGDFFGATQRHKLFDVSLEGLNFKYVYSYHPSFMNRMHCKDAEEIVESLRKVLRECGVL